MAPSLAYTRVRALVSSQEPSWVYGTDPREPPLLL